MNLGSRIAAWFGGKKLPYDAEVEYLEATGTQLIDTNVKLASIDCEVRITFSIREGIESVNICGVEEVVDEKRYYGLILYGPFSGGKINAYHGFSNAYLSFDFKKDKEYKVVQKVINSTAIVNIDGVEYSKSITNRNRIFSNSFYIFGTIRDRSTGLVYGYGCSRIKHCEVYSNQVKVAEMIPVRKDGVGYMYDRVSGQLFGNAGTGEFIIGPDKN